MNASYRQKAGSVNFCCVTFGYRQMFSNSLSRLAGVCVYLLVMRQCVAFSLSSPRSQRKTADMKQRSNVGYLCYHFTEVRTVFCGLFDGPGVARFWRAKFRIREKKCLVLGREGPWLRNRCDCTRCVRCTVVQVSRSRSTKLHQVGTEVLENKKERNIPMVEPRNPGSCGAAAWATTIP